MLLAVLIACSAHVNVQSTHPEARVGIAKGPQPSAAGVSPVAEGRGSVQARVPFWAGSRVWAYAFPPDAELGAPPVVVPVPKVAKGGPIASCAAGLFLWPFLPGCFFVAGPTSSTVLVTVPE